MDFKILYLYYKLWCQDAIRYSVGGWVAYSFGLAYIKDRDEDEHRGGKDERMLGDAMEVTAMTRLRAAADGGSSRLLRISFCNF